MEQSDRASQGRALGLGLGKKKACARRRVDGFVDGGDSVRKVFQGVKNPQLHRNFMLGKTRAWFYEKQWELWKMCELRDEGAGGAVGGSDEGCRMVPNTYRGFSLGKFLC